MEIHDETEATDYFEACVRHNMSFGTERDEAERIEKINFGYYAGYYDEETRRQVERLFSCAHPIFGAIAINGPPTLDEAFEAGKSMAG